MIIILYNLSNMFMKYLIGITESEHTLFISYCKNIFHNLISNIDEIIYKATLTTWNLHTFSPILAFSSLQQKSKSTKKNI